MNSPTPASRGTFPHEGEGRATRAAHEAMAARHANDDANDHRSSIVHLHPLRWPIFSPVITFSTSHFPFTIHEEPWCVVMVFSSSWPVVVSTSPYYTMGNQGESWSGWEVGRKRKKMLLHLRLDWVGLGACTATAWIRCSGPDSMVHHCAVCRPSPRGFSKLPRFVLSWLHQ